MRFPNFGLALVALIISMSIWLYVENQRDLIETRRVTIPLVPIQSNPNPEYVVLGPLPKTASAVLSGTPEQLDRFILLYSLRASDTAKADARIDLGNLREGQTSIRPRATWQNSDLAAMRIEAELIDVPISVEERSEKRVPVEINAVNVPERYQYNPDLSAIFPSTVSVSGAKSRVTTVAKIVGVADFTSFKTGSPQIDVTSLQPQTSAGQLVEGVSVDNSSVTVTPNLGPFMPREAVVVMPKIEGTPAVGYRYYHCQVTPNTVLATGPDANKIQSIETKPIRITGLTGNSTRRQVVLVVPKGVTTLSQKTVDVEIFIEKIQPIENPVPVPVPNPNSTGATGATGATGTTGTPPN